MSMVGLLCTGLLVLIIWALWSKQPVVKVLARVFTGLVALASATGMVFLFWVGQRAHWTSDGPGMLAVMIGIVFCGLFAILFGGLFFSSFNRSSGVGETGTQPPLNT